MRLPKNAINQQFFLFLCILYLSFVYVLSHPRTPTSDLVSSGIRNRGSVYPKGSTPTLPFTTDNGCSNICQHTEGIEPSILKYKENEIYKYKSEGLASIHLPNSVKGESTKLNYIANFDIIAESKCSFILRISSIEIIGPDGKKYSDRSLLGYPARYSWNNGKLDKFCADKQESTTASNLKRSIITNLQISSWGNPLSRSSSADMGSAFETDIYGRCQVTIESAQEQDGSWTIKKNKDLNQCKYRQGYDFAVGTSTYISDSPFQTNPFVQANLKSVIRVEKGIVRSVEVNEQYDYQPLTNYGDSQTSVVVVTKITLQGKSKNGNAFTSLNPTPSTLLFENEKSPNTDTTVPTIIKAIQDASSLDDSGVLPSDVAKSFSQFVSILQQAKRTDILTTYAQVKSGAGFKNKENARTVFWDGLITAGTPAAVETAATLLLNNEMPEDEISKFLICLSFVKHPTEETLIIVSTLLDGPNVDVGRYLGVGSLVRKYVLDHPNKVSPQLITVLNKLTLPLLKPTASKTIEEEDQLIASLKGLKNAQFLTPNVSEAVRGIVSSKEATTRARVAALQTLMVNSSDESNRKLALEILKSKDEDAEMRINAFHAYINNPTPQTAETIKNLLDCEESDQVGSYITSFLKNLRSTTKPEKELLKQYYGDIRTNKKFPFDFRQYSQNYQLSQLFSALNLGYSAEADLIYTSQSYVPRFSSLSLNSYLFGNAFNLLEVDTRIENLEHLIEKLAGPRSYMQSTDAEDIADDLVDQVQSFAGKMAQKVASMGRSKRAIDKPIITQAKKQKTSLSDKYIDFDLSVKMFESEVKWFNIHADKDNVGATDFLDILHKQIDNAIDGAKNIDVDYKRYARSPILSNNVIHYPTSSGFAIKLSTDVNSVINLKLKGSVDIPKIMNKPKSTDIQLQIVPSAVLQVDGMLEIDGSIITAGLKASSSVRTATGVDLKFNVLDGQGFDVKIGVPIKEQDLFTMNTEVFSTVRERGLPSTETKLNAAGKRYNYGGTFDQLSDIIGLSLIAQVSSPAFSYKPTVGPGMLSLRLVKEDELLQYYEIKAYYDDKKSDYRSIELTFDTPGSKINRKISLFAESNTTERRIAANLISPLKQIHFEGKGMYTDNEVSYHLKLANDLAEYTADVGATITHDKQKTIYKPYLKLHLPGDNRDTTSLDKVRVNRRQAPQMVTVNGLIILEKNKNKPKYRKYDFKDLTLTSPIGKVSMNGPIYVDPTNPEFGSDITIAYGEPKNTITIKSYFNNSKNTDAEEQIDADLAIMPSQLPEYGFKYTMNIRNTPNSIERKVSLVHGPDLNSQVSKITLKQILNLIRDTKNGSVTSMNGQFTASYPLWKFNLDAGFEETNNNYFIGNSALTMDRTNLELNGSLGIENRKVGNVDVQLQSKLNERSLTLSAIRELVDVDKSSLVINLNAKPGKQIVISADLTHAIKPLYYVLRSESTVTVSPNKIYKHDMGLKYTPDEKSIHLASYPNNERSLELRASYATPHPAIYVKGVTYIRNIIDGVVNFEKENDKATGDLNINIIKTNRLINGKLDLNVINDSNYQGYLELFWDASKDTSKKLKINTNTVLNNHGSNFTTENTVEFTNYAFQANANYNLQGEIINGTILGGLELIMPKGPRFGIQINRTRTTRNVFTDYDLKVQGIYYKANTNVPIDVNYGFTGKNIDLTRMMFDVVSVLTVNTTKTKNIKFGLSAKNKVVKDIWSIGGSVLLDGTMVKNKTNLLFDTSFSNLVQTNGLLSKQPDMPPTTYRISGYFGENYIIDLDGKFEKSEWSNILLLRVPVKNQPFEIKYTGVTEIDITPSKTVLIKTSNVLIWEDKKFLNWEALFEVQPNFGKLNLIWETTGVSSRTLKMGYSYGLNQKEGLLGPFLLFTTNFTFDNKQANCLMKLEYSKDLTSRMLTVSGESPTSGQFHLRAINTLSDNNHNIYNEVTLHTNNGKWAAVSLISMYPTKPAINLTYVSPEGESKFIMNFEEKVKNYWTGSADISWIHGGEGYLKADCEMKLDSNDDILIKLYLDAPILQMNNFSLIATNKASGDVKRKIKFDTKMMDTSLASGSLSYTYQVDNQKLIFESDGVVKLQNKNRPITFKYSKFLLTPEATGENGSKNKLYFSLDNKKYVLDLEATFTDKSLLLKRDLWYGDKCYKMDISYNVKSTDSVNYEENIIAHIDLKPFFKNGEEFTVEGKTIRSLSNYNNRVSLQWAPDKNIEYTLYSSIGKAGISFTLPKRQLAAETTYSYKTDALDGHFKVSSNVWFDKKRDENQKLMISLGNEYNIPEDKSDFLMRSSALFQIPTLPKIISLTNDVQLSPYDVKTIDVKTVLDIFQTTEQAIVVTYQVNKQRKDNGYLLSDHVRLYSVGQQLDAQLNRSSLFCLDHIEMHLGVDYTDYRKSKKSSNLDLEIRLNSISGQLEIMNIPLIKGRAELGMGSNYFEIREDWNILNHNYSTTFRLTTQPGLITVVEWKGDIKQKVLVNTSLAFGEHLNVDARLLDNTAKNVLTFMLFLDDARFLQSKSEIFIDNLKVVLDNGKADLLVLIEDGKKAFKAVSTNFNVQMAFRIKKYREAAIEFKPAIESANNYIASVRDEIKNDPSLVNATQNVKKIIHSAADSVMVFLQQVSAFLGDWVYGYNLFMNKLAEFFERILPEIDNLYQTTVDDITAWLKDMVNYYSQMANNVVEYVKINKDNWKEIVSSAIETFKESIKTAHDMYEQMRADITEFIEKTKQYITSLPITNYLQTKLIELKNSQVPKYAWSLLSELGQALKDSVSSPELKNLIDTILSTVDKLLNDKPYDIKEEMKNIGQSLIETVRALIVAINNSNYIKDITSNSNNWPKFSLSAFKNIPNFWTVSTSVVNWIRDPDFAPMQDVFMTYKLGLGSPTSLIPPFKRIGAIVDGQNIITFSGNHYSINGESQYLLVADFTDYNFTVVGDIRHGKLMGLAVASNSHSIEIFPDKIPNLDKVPTDYPVHSDGIYAVRNPHSITVFIDNSLAVNCLTNFEVCTVEVSGFYQNKAYGLLGTVNSEKYMDFTMPNLNISKDIQQFVKSYDLRQGSYSATRSISNDTTDSSRTEQCTEMFNGNSVLSRGFSFVDSQPYRSMCDQMVSQKTSDEDKMETACKAAVAYSLVSYANSYYLNLPSICAKCSMNGKDIPYGFSSTVTMPQNKADIVIILEEIKDNEFIYNELISKSMPIIQKSLADKGITDVNFGIIGYGPENEQPSIRTTNGKLTVDKNTKIVFSNTPPKMPRSSLGQNVKNIKYFLGNYDSKKALQIANDYPYRNDAIRAIIQVKGNIDDIALDKYNIYSAIVNTIVSWNIISNKFPIFMVTTLPKVESNINLSEVFGFDTRNVYTVDGTKPMVNYLELFRMYKAAVILPLSSDGTVFNSSVFIDNSSKQSQMTSVFANSVISSLTTYQRIFDCTCKYKYGIYSEPQCSLIHTNLIETKG